MYMFETFLTVVDSLLDTPRKRHIIGGLFISLSTLFAGLAVTTLTIDKESKNE